MTANDNSGRWTTEIAYGKDSHLQTYNVYRRGAANIAQQTWIIYIHGGYFRDPQVSADCFEATVNELESSNPPPLSSIAGYATLNYRLSKHVDHPQPADTLPFDLRNAQWPDHIADVLTGLRQLQDEYLFGANYLLVGHSAGALLALLVSLRAKDHGFAAPRAVLGLSGIYDLPLIHESHPEYKALTFNAMKEGEEVAASPVYYVVDEYEDAGVEQVMLGHSKDDGLAPWNQVERMQEALVRGKAGEGYVQVIELFGKHDDIWGDGRETSRAILAALDAMVKSD